MLTASLPQGEKEERESNSNPMGDRTYGQEERQEVSSKEAGRKEIRSEEASQESSEAQTQRRFHEAVDVFTGARGSDRRQADAAHRSHQAALGLHQEE
jgi:hypothetical protein